MENAKKIKVLITDDSPVVREILKDMLLGEPDLEVVGEAENGKEAVRLTKELAPDVITMDVMMPVMGGLEAVEEIMAYTPTPILVFSSALDDKEMDVAFQAINRGALDVLEKPKVASGAKYEEIRKDLIEKIRLISGIQVIPHIRAKRKKSKPGNKILGTREPEETGPSPAAPPNPDSPLLEHHQIKSKRKKSPPEPEPGEEGLVVLPPPHLVKRKLVAVGASTGGPKALVQIFRRFPPGFPVPVLVVQHIASNFAHGLASWLGRESAMEVKLAEDRTRPLSGHLYLAPSGKHMVFSKGLIRLTDEEPINSCKPSADALFLSVAEEAGPSAVGVLLTGMGRDGARGLGEIKSRQGKTIVQDEKTSVIFGMPKAAIEIGAAEEVVPLPKIPEAIARALTRK